MACSRWVLPGPDSPYPSSGLYAFPGASATATAAAWANRFDEPMTKVSKVYFGLRRASPCASVAVWLITDPLGGGATEASGRPSAGSAGSGPGRAASGTADGPTEGATDGAGCGCSSGSSDGSTVTAIRM